MTLKLTPKVQEEIDIQGAAAYPYEGCGLLLGQVHDGHNLVTAVFTVENRWPAEEERRERFHIAADDMLQAELAAMRQGLEVVGIFHSHPDCAPVASARDLAWAAWPGYSYLITEVRHGRPVGSRSWQLLADRSGFHEEEITLADL
jgi:proteasome lid subunit RPN8/RPN11